MTFLIAWQSDEAVPTATRQVTSRPGTTVPQESVPLTASPIPTQKILPGGIQVFQTFNNCGPASLSMAFSHYGVTKSQAELGQALRPFQVSNGDNDDKSVTLSEMAALAEASGFVPYHRPGGNAELMKRMIAAGWPVITRTWLKPGEDIGHYRVVKGYDETTQEFIQDDSLQGKDLLYSYQEFDRLWQAFNYEFLVLVPASETTTIETILGSKADSHQAWQEALATADLELEKTPGAIFAQFNRAVALYHLGMYRESVSAYEQIAARLPRRMLWYQLEPLLAYYRIGDTDQVLALTDQILTHDNRAYSELYQLRGMIYERQGESELARAAYEAAVRYNQSTYWQVNLDSDI